jgi:hypothetical protein
MRRETVKRVLLTRISFVAIVCICPHASSMEIEKEEIPLHVYTIPDLLTGWGSEESYIQKLLPPTTTYTFADIPQEHTDYFKQLETAFSKKNAQNSIIWATGDGATLALDYLTQHKLPAHIKALVLESPALGSYHISHTIPVAIVHGTKDMLGSSDDAYTLYYTLRKNGNNHVYLISKDSYSHIRLLADEDASLLEALLQQYDLIPKNDTNFNLTPYQPDPETYKQHYKTWRERRSIMKTLRKLSQWGAVMTALYYLADCI